MHPEPCRLALSLIGGRYCWTRLTGLASRAGWPEAPPGTLRRSLWRLLGWLEAAAKLASLGNLVVFLYEGRYRSLLERLLGARLVYRQASQVRAITFEYLHRQLVLQELSRLALLLLPMLHPARVARTARELLLLARERLWPPAGQQTRLGQGDSAPAASGVAAPAQAQPLPPPRSGKCAFCGAVDILNPFAAVPCGHRFCYYCLRANVEADPRYRCPECFRVVAAMRREEQPE